MIKTMFSRKSRFLRASAMTAAVLVFFVATATAAFKLRITASGAAPITITDQDFVGPPPDGNPLAGAILWSGSLGDFSVLVTSSLSKPALGSVNKAEMDLTNVSVSTVNGGTILIETTDTDFTGSGQLLASSVGGTISNGSVSFDAWAGGNNAEFSHTGAHTSLGPFTGPAFSGTAGANGVSANPFSMTSQASATLNAGGSMSFDFDNQVVPEGSSLALLLPGLAPLGLILRRRMKKA